jgi:hypothetical protein
MSGLTDACFTTGPIGGADDYEKTGVLFIGCNDFHGRDGRVAGPEAGGG